MNGLISESGTGVRFLLFRRPLDDGLVSIVLHLYRDGKPATRTTLATVKPSVARLTLLASRLHLITRGVEEYCPHMPRAATLDVAQAA